MIKVYANSDRIKGYHTLKSLENNSSDKYIQCYCIIRFVFNLQSVSFNATFNEDYHHFSEYHTKNILKVRCEESIVTFHDTARCTPVVDKIIFEELNDYTLRVKLGNYADIECHRIFAKVDKIDIRDLTWGLMIR